ncbi:MAG: SusD/RagB family nutrient-binding outer membrane lipoprotein [Candidatus Symbiothrix sp.]|jgi:hypothetical protein|nr:SusD/RagB family nutrient-binding outer membrane lipoprotein [Candidatus Symbiothrix sp.]
MKLFKNIFMGLSLTAMVAMTACSDFEELNKNPRDMGVEAAKPEYFLNRSVINAQQDPHIAERMFILTWKAASRFDRSGGFTLGSDNNGWITDYYGVNYGGGCLITANQAVAIGEEQLATGLSGLTTSNVVQMARIWRACVMAELACGFGPVALNGEYASEKDAFYFILTELKDAAAKLDPSVDMSSVADLDAFYGGNVTNWVKYANSLRMRYAMLLSVVDNAKAKAEFEDAAQGSKILNITDMAAVAEKDGWDALTGVMTRSWNAQPISPTYNNLVVGLGGQAFDVPAELQTSLKDPQTYLGLYLDKHFPLTTNDPCAGYFFDGIPSKIDPRATKLYNIPGYDDGIIYPGGDLATTADLLKPEVGSTDVAVTLTTKYSWSTCVAGSWDNKAGYSADLVSDNNNFPRISKAYRTSANKRVWFAPWETEFLLAEAAVYGWSVTGSAQSHYEAGIRASFDYLGVGAKADAYLASSDYNRVGTSVSFTHTAEATSFTINYKDGYSNEAKTTTYTYPVNSIHNGGATNNDALTKIITQKYLAFVPWQPLEAWNDQRRLGLPFMENQAVEVAYPVPTQVALTPSTSKECKLEYYPKRYRYPATLETTNPEGYAKAIQLLGGTDLATTPLWWNKK